MSARPARAGYATLLLAVIFALAAVDRSIMAILLAPIQAELRVGDAAMGALTGIAFTAVYATAALPLARWADRGNRARLLAGAVAVWSVMTAACGFAGSYITLLMARMGVALGEAAHQPATLSLVSDLHPRERRGRAISVLSIGTAIGVGLGAIAVGALSDRYGWRAAFVVMGGLGIAVAVLLALTLREPMRGQFDGAGPSGPAGPTGLLQGLKRLAEIRTIRWLIVAQVFYFLSVHGFSAWAPAFLMRDHGLTATQMSVGFGLSVSIASIISMGIGGVVGDRLARRGERWRALYCAASAMACAPGMLLAILAPRADLSLLGIFLQVLAGAGATAASLTLSVNVVRPDQRGITAAVITFSASVIGGGLGPLMIGLLSDLLRDQGSQDGLRLGLLITPIFIAMSGAAFLVVARSANADAARAQ